MKKTMISMVLAAVVGWAAVAVAEEAAAPVSIDAGLLEQILSFTEKLGGGAAEGQTSQAGMDALAKASGFSDYAQYANLLQVLMRCVAGLGAEDVSSQLKASVPSGMLPMLSSQLESLDAQTEAGKKSVDGDTWSLLRENLSAIQSRIGDM